MLTFHYMNACSHMKGTHLTSLGFQLFLACPSKIYLSPSCICFDYNDNECDELSKSALILTTCKPSVPHRWFWSRINSLKQPVVVWRSENFNKQLKFLFPHPKNVLYHQLSNKRLLLLLLLHRVHFALHTPSWLLSPLSVHLIARGPRIPFLNFSPPRLFSLRSVAQAVVML